MPSHIQEVQHSAITPELQRFVAELNSGGVPDNNNAEIGQLVDSAGLPIESSAPIAAEVGGLPAAPEGGVAVAFIIPIYTEDRDDLRRIFTLEGVPEDRQYDLAISINGKAYLIRNIEIFEQKLNGTYDWDSDSDPVKIADN